MTRWQTWIAVVGVLGLIEPAATCAQGVAFFPNVASFPNGAILSTTPVVSADRRYVRLGVVPQFTEIEAFNTFQIPAAVTGGPGNGLGGGGVGVGGGGVVGFAGMNGPMAGPPDSDEGSFPAGRRGGRLGPTGVASSSSDFEDQMWPQAVATRKTPAPVSRAKAKPGRKKPTTKTAKPAGRSQVSRKR
jgi:hypothetical protein